MEVVVGLRLGQSPLDQGVPHEVGDSDTRRARTEDHDPVLVEVHAGHIDAGQDRRQHHRCGALDVVVERAVVVLVLRQDAVGVARTEVLPMDHRLGEEPVGRHDEVIDEVVVPLSAHPRVPFTEVHLIVEEAQIVRPDVERQRHDAAGMDARCGGVDRGLADSDLYAANALVADAQNALGVGDDDEIHVVGIAAVVEHRLFDVILPIDRQKDAARTDVFVAESLDRLADRRRIDDRQHLVEVLAEQVVEEDLVSVAQLREVHVLPDGGARPPELLIDPSGLILEARDAAGKKSDQPQQVSFGHGERRTPVGHRVRQHRPAASGYAHGVRSDGRVLE